MTLTKQELVYFFSNSPTKGAIVDATDPAKFTVNLKNPLTIPDGASNITIECLSANVWFTSPNISTTYKNNTLWLKYEYAPNPPIEFFLVIPNGLYTVSSLSAEVQRQMSKTKLVGAVPNTILFTTDGYFKSEAICFTGNQATQRVIVNLGKDLQMITDTTKVNNIAPTLGFTHNPLLTISGSLADTNHAYEADSTAKFNKINQYLLHGSIVDHGLSYNDQYSFIIAEFQVDKPAGHLITYRPFIPYRVDGSKLKSAPLTSLDWYLTNENGVLVDLNGEEYSFSIVIRYDVEDTVLARGRR